MKKHLFITLLIVFIVFDVFAQKVFNDFDEFKDACAVAQPGEELILANGTYLAESIKIEDVKSTEEDPLIIRAEAVGKVILTDEAFFDIRHSEHVVIQGFVINVLENSTTIKIQTCNNIRITQNVIDGTNEPYFKDDDPSERNSSVWISIQSLWDDKTGLSHHNKIDHNVFQNKHTLGNMIKIDGTDEKQVSQYDVIQYNHFKNMGPRAENEMEAIRVGWSEMSESDGFCTIQNNLFEECNGDPEIVSVKCNKNTIAHNTFLRCQGTLSLRHGNESIVEGNFFLGEGVEGTGGVRLYGTDHRVINNYFEGLTGTRWDAPITLTEGDADEGNGSLNKHFRIERAVIASNTVINCDYGIEIGYDNNGKYGKPPRDVIVANNIVSGSKNALVNYINEPINITWIDNVLHASNDAVVGQNVTFNSDEAQHIDPLLEFSSQSNLYQATSNSPVYATMAAVVGEIVTDFEGQTRVSPFNYGADEWDTSDISYGPLSAKDVGVTTEEYLHLSQTLFNVSKEGETVKVSVSSNLNWKVNTEEEWIKVSPETGDGDEQLSVVVSENNTGEMRSATIKVEGTNAEDQAIVRSLEINQSEKSEPFLTVSTQHFQVGSNYTEVELNVNSNVSWVVKTHESWITSSPENGDGNGTIKLHVSNNESIVSRVGLVQITDGMDLVQDVEIDQQGVESNAEKITVISVVASTEEVSKGNIAANLIDGDLTNRWSGEGDGAYVTLDMGDEYRISHFKIGVYKAHERQSTFDLLVSSDGESFNELLMDETTEISDEELLVFDTDDVNARFVKLVGHGNSSNEWNSYSEIEVWGFTSNTAFEMWQGDDGIKLFPNPCSHVIHIDGAVVECVEVFNLKGACVSTHNHTNNVNVEHLNSGQYTVKIRDIMGNVSSKSFIKY